MRFVSLVLAALFLPACPQPGAKKVDTRSYVCGAPVEIAGWHPAHVKVTYEDSEGDDTFEEYDTEIGVWQVGSALHYWGVPSELCENLHSFDQKTPMEQLTIIGLQTMTFAGEGDADSGLSLVYVEGEIIDLETEKVWYSWTAVYEILLLDLFDGEGGVVVGGSGTVGGDPHLQPRRTVASLPEEEGYRVLRKILGE